MANVSTAYGTVCAYAKTKENAKKKILNIIYGWLENVDYINVHKDETLTAKYTNKDWITASRFTGTKRWVFEDDVRQLSEWLQEDMNELKPLDFRLKFEFNDYEPKSLNRHQTTITADHKANDPEIKFKISKDEYNEYTFYPEQPSTEKIDEKEHTEEKQEKIENAQINNEDENDKKALESNQHSEGNNTLGTIYVPKKLEAGTYTLTKTKTPAEEKNSRRSPDNNTSYFVSCITSSRHYSNFLHKENPVSHKLTGFFFFFICTSDMCSVLIMQLIVVLLCRANRQLGNTQRLYLTDCL